MLVLSRRIGEKVMLPSLNVTIEILDIHGSRVVVGFSAPDNIRIRRAELPPLTRHSTAAEPAPADAARLADLPNPAALAKH